MQNGQIVEKRSMHVPGLDDGRVDEGDPDLEVGMPSEGPGADAFTGSKVNAANEADVQGSREKSGMPVGLGWGWLSGFWGLVRG